MRDTPQGGFLGASTLSRLPQRDDLVIDAQLRAAGRRTEERGLYRRLALLIVLAQRKAEGRAPGL
jgi:hypothetical protein